MFECVQLGRELAAAQELNPMVEESGALHLPSGSAIAIAAPSQHWDNLRKKLVRVCFYVVCVCGLLLRKRHPWGMREMHMLTPATLLFRSR